MRRLSIEEMMNGLLSEGEQNMSGIPLADAISELRKQINIAMSQAQDEELKFRLGTVELELEVGLEKSGEANAEVKAWVLSMGASGKLSNTQTHRIKLVLEPETADGGDVKVKRK